mmetsp:Transcript_16477/g.18572  ORF Transcript_16477/g.18572 Transcript_16477/m.18572 type:complete len:146 (+) Transcript_16477:55-492(+)
MAKVTRNSPKQTTQLGPGTYDFEIQPRSPAFSLSKSVRKLEDVTEVQNNDFPGPGSYSSRNPNHETVKGRKFAGFREHRRLKERDTKYDPGPGSYNADKRATVTGGGFLASPRFIEPVEEKNDEDQPGPGAYDPPISLRQTKSSA